MPSRLREYECLQSIAVAYYWWVRQQGLMHYLKVSTPYGPLEIPTGDYDHHYSINILLPRHLA